MNKTLRTKTVLLMFATFMTLSSLTQALLIARAAVARENTVYLYAGPVPAPENWNPYVVPQPLNSHGLHQWENLFYTNEVTTQTHPWIGESFTYNADYTNMTLKIRKGVKWNDGRPFTADDIVFTYDMLKKNAPTLTQSQWINVTIKSAKKIDDWTVTFTFWGQQPRAHYNMFWANWPINIAPKHIWQDKDPVTFKNYPNPVWTGAYKLTSVDATSMIFDRDNNWWGKDVFGWLPWPERLVYVIGVVMSVDKMIVSASAGEYEYYQNFPFSSYLKAREKNPDLKFWAAIDACPRSTAFNTQIYPFNKKEVRWAISYALNRTKINLAVYEGMSMPARTPFPDYRGLDKYMFDDVLAKYDITKYNLTRANQILKNLGWTKGTDNVWRTENGTRLGPYIYPSAQGPEAEAYGMSVADQLRAFGIDVTHKPTESTTFTDQRERGLYPIWQGWLCGLGVAQCWDPWALWVLWQSKYSNVPTGTLAPMGQNPATRWYSTEFDTVVDQLTAMNKDDPKAMPLYKKALELWLDALPVVPQLQAMWGMIRNERNWVGWATETNNYIHPFNHHKMMYLQIVNLKPARWTPPPIEAVYAKQPIARFLGVDMKMYGPYVADELVNIPSPDASRIVAAGQASRTSPVSAQLTALTQEVTNLKKTIDGLNTKVTDLEGRAGSATTTTYAAVGVSVIAIAVAVVSLLRKRT